MSEGRRTAGHTFVLGRCSCGVMWEDIRDVDRSFIGKYGVAHTAYLTEVEYAEIKARDNEEKTQIAVVMGW